MEPTETVAAVLRSLARHPIRHFVRGWNWKSAAVSSVCRGVLFFCVNVSAGFDEGLKAFASELAFRGVVSGALGSATQAFRTASPAATAMIVALILIPAVGHAAEYAAHRLAGTARLGESIAASVAFSMLSTAFNLFAMRRGALIVGAGRRSLGDDLVRVPALAAGFVRAIADVAWTLATAERRKRGSWSCRRCI